MIEGNNIRLRCLEQGDLPLIANWRNQQQVRRFFFHKGMISVSGQNKWFERYLQDLAQEIFIAENKADGKPIGMIGLYHIDHRMHRAEIGSTMVGDPESRGKGFATEMIVLLLEYAFVDLNLHRIYAYAIDTNTSSLRVKQKCGFTIEGTLRQDHFTNGQFHDVYIMGILREEWMQNNGAAD